MVSRVRENWWEELKNRSKDNLKHMFATTMLANGADLAAVSKLMSHAGAPMTADVYYQYMQGEKERAVSLLPSLPAV